MLSGVQAVFGRSEVALRAPNAVFGVLAVLVTVAFVARYDRPRVAIMTALLIACHPVLIHHARNNKVFGLEVLFCPLLFWCGYEAYLRMTAASVWRLVIAGVVGLGMTFSASFILAGWSPVLLWKWLLDGERRRSLTPHVVAGGALLTACAIGWVVWLLGCTFRGAMEDYFATQEVCWPTSYSLAGLAKWVVLSSAEIGKFVLAVNAEWPPITWCIATAQFVLIMAAVGLLWRRHKPVCVAFVLAMLFVFIAGAAKLWPIGRVRTMTFLVPMVMMVAAVGAGELLRRMRWSTGSMAILLFAVGVPTLQAIGWGANRPQAWEHFRPVFQYVDANAKTNDALFVYYGAADAIEFYGEHTTRVKHYDAIDKPYVSTLVVGGHELPMYVEPASDRKNFDAFIKQFDAWLAEHDRTWIVFAHPHYDEVDVWLAALLERYPRIDTFETHDCSAHLFVTKSR